MSDRLDPLPEAYYGTTHAAPAPSRVSTLLRAVLLLGLFAAGGVGGGYAWRHLWTPPDGQAVSGSWVPTPVEQGLQNDFSGVGWYVVAAVGVGLVLGFLTALVLGRAELLALAVVVVGSALAAYLVLTTGERLSPPDPDRVAARSADGTTIPGDLEFDGWTPLMSCPVGALTSLGVVYLLTNRRGSYGDRRHDSYLAATYSTQV